MPTFPTPEPITASIELNAGSARIIAGEYADTVVDVRPSDTSHEADVRAAEQTRVEFSAGRLLIKTPKQRGLGLFARAGYVDITVQLPIGSTLEAEGAAASFRSSGQLGETRIKTSAGDMELDRTGRLTLTGVGAIAVNHVGGDATVSSGSGKVRLRKIDGKAVIKNANGDNWIGQISGDLRVNTANGEIVVDQAGADVTASTANGEVRLGEVVRGFVLIKTGAGRIEVGIRHGTAARLDVHTSYGRLIKDLDAVDGPAPTDETVSVRALTSYGDIMIRRATTETTEPTPETTEPAGPDFTKTLTQPE
jgi:DUF4097 and DUF4098 domain-containing protein YvlB